MLKEVIMELEAMKIIRQLLFLQEKEMNYYLSLAKIDNNDGGTVLTEDQKYRIDIYERAAKYITPD